MQPVHPGVAALADESTRTQDEIAGSPQSSGLAAYLCSGRNDKLMRVTIASHARFSSDLNIFDMSARPSFSFCGANADPTARFHGTDRA
jgi:hypothetical protein